MKALYLWLLVLSLIVVQSSLASVNTGGRLARSFDEVTVITLGDPITVAGAGVIVAGSTATIIAEGTYRVSGTLADGMLEVSTAGEVQVILDGASITHSDGPAIQVTSAAKAIVVLADGSSNTLVDGMTYADAKGTLFSNDPLEIMGNGALAVTGHYKHGIVSDDSLTLFGGNISIAAKTDGLHANDDITIHGGTLNITLANDGMESEGTLLIDGGVLTVAAADDGITSATALAIHGGTIAITTAVDGIDSKTEVTIQDGAIEIAASQNGLKATNNLTVNGGQIYVDSAGNALRCVGALTINDGLLVALGGAAPGGGLVGSPIALNGGVVVATGGSNGTPASSSLQRVAVLPALGTGPVLRIARGEADVLTFEVTKPFGSMIFTSPAMPPDQEHTVYAGGAASGGTSFHGLYTNATYAGGSVWAVFTTRAVVTYVLRGDVDADCDVDIVDIMAVAARWSAASGDPRYDSRYDLDSDSDIDVVDIMAVATHWGERCEGAATPTPFPTRTATVTPTPTSTPESTATPTATPVPTVAPTPTATATPYDVGTVITLGTPITVVGSGVVVSDTEAIIVAGGTYRVSGTLADGMISVDTGGEVRLLLDGVALTDTTGPAIRAVNAAKLSLVLVDGTSSTLADGDIYWRDFLAKGTVFSKAPLEISGHGALAISSLHKQGLHSGGNVVIHSGDIAISTAGDGIHVVGNISVHGGTIEMTRADDGLDCDGELLVEGGVFTLAAADDGMASVGPLTVNGGTIYVLSGIEGIESKANLTINGGWIEVAVSDDGLNATTDITLNGGQVYLNADGDAIDSNGTLHINGGVLVALGGKYPDGGLDCDFNEIPINGGIVVATGGEHSVPSGQSAQRVVLMGEWPVGEVIHIARDGADVLTFALTKHCQSMLFTSPALLPNQVYTLYTGGSVSGGVDFYGLYSGATYVGGSVWGTFNTEAVVTHVGGPAPEPFAPGW